jgi:hypothetical protein
MLKNRAAINALQNTPMKNFVSERIRALTEGPDFRWLEDAENDLRQVKVDVETKGK